MRRREFLIASAAMAATACGSTILTVAPSTTAPLLAVLRSKGYSVTVEHSLDGGSILIVNGKKSKIIIGGVLIGVDSNRNIAQSDNGPLTFDVANYPVPDDIEPTFAT